jgi:hypothetical protein
MKSSKKGDWLPRWGGGQRKTIYLCALVLGSCALVLLIYLQNAWSQYQAQTAGHPAHFGDFFALWSYAKILTTHPAAELYDFATLHARQVALGMESSAQNPFPYPPMFLILLWPLGLLPYDAAYLAWTVGTLALFIWAVVRTCSRLPLSVIGVIVAPTSIACIGFGQSGFLAAALIIAGVRLAGSRPILSGILIGILSYKPQLALLVPIALASAGLWPAFGVACATVIGLAAITTITFGWAVWPAWISMLPSYAAIFDREATLKYIPTVLGNLQVIGVALPIAKAIQGLVAIVVAVLIWRCFRRGPTRLAAAALLVGTFLATPHAFVYDMPMTTAAIILFIEAHLEETAEFSLAEILILILAFMVPLLMLTHGPTLPVGSLPLVLLFGLILWQEKRYAPGLGPVAPCRSGGNGMSFWTEFRSRRANLRSGAISR